MVLNQMGWNISATAYKLGISARQLFNKINEYNLENPRLAGLRSRCTVSEAR